MLEGIADLHDVGPVELRQMWVDDYSPGSKHKYIFHPGVWERHIAEWLSWFTDDELHALAEFDAVFEAERPALSFDWPEWRQNPGWLRVSVAARLTLARMRPMDIGPG